jgi:hypothetical protein
METLVIDRKTLPEPFLSYIDTNRVIRAERDADSVVFTPATGGIDEFDDDDDINPDDYDDDTDYINAIPGMKERLLKSLNAPASEFKPAPEKFFNV